MKKLTMLFVLAFGFALVNADAQEPTPTPVLPRVYIEPALVPPSIVRLDSGQNVDFQFYVFNDNASIPATDVIVNAKLSPSLTFVSASVSGFGSCSYADDTITCNLGTVEKHPYDYSRIIKIYAKPTVAETVTIFGTIKGSNTLISNFGNSKTVNPAKSRKRVRFNSGN